MFFFSNVFYKYTFPRPNNWAPKHRGGLGPRILLCKKFYEGHKDIAEITSHHFKKASIPLKMYLNSLTILEKALISLKKSSKIIEIFIKAPQF
jgi:hypothetical protein